MFGIDLNAAPVMHGVINEGHPSTIVVGLGSDFNKTVENDFGLGGGDGFLGS